MAERQPDVEGAAGPFGNANESWANYLNNYLMYKAMGLNPDPRGGGVSVPMPATNPSAEALVAEATVPTIASRQIGTGLGTDPTDIASQNLGDMTWDSTLGRWVKKATSVVTGKGDGAPSWLPDVLKMLAGVGTGLAGALTPRSLSDEEKAFQAQAARLLKQQEQRTQFQNPLYAYITQQAYNLQPGPNKGAYPYNSLDDVQVP